LNSAHIHCLGCNFIVTSSVFLCHPNGVFRTGHTTHLSHAFLPSYMHYTRPGLMF
jgi:hypothetical protein